MYLLRTRKSEAVHIDEFQAFHLTEKGPDKFWGLQVRQSSIQTDRLLVCQSVSHEGMGKGKIDPGSCTPSTVHLALSLTYSNRFSTHATTTPNNRWTGPLWTRTQTPRWAREVVVGMGRPIKGAAAGGGVVGRGGDRCGWWWVYIDRCHIYQHNSVRGNLKSAAMIAAIDSGVRVALWLSLFSTSIGSKYGRTILS